jgi:hypothetical protein
MADSIAFGGRFYRRRKGYAYDHSLRVAQAPILLSVNYDQGDTAGGGESIVLTGINFTNAVGVSFGGTAATITANTSTTVTCTLPAKSAGATSVTVSTLGGGTSNGLSFEFWAPPTDSAVTVLYDSIGSTVYNGTTWAARYTTQASTDLGQGLNAVGNVVASAGAPVFDGNQATESGLRGAQNWSSFFGTADGNSNQPASIAAVLKSTNIETLSAGAPYGNPQAIGNTDQGVIGLAYGRQGGVTPGFMGHGYSSLDGYVTSFVAASADTYHAVINRFGPTGGNTIDVSVDGSLSGAGYTSTSTAGAGIHAVYSNVPITMGVFYPGTTPAYQIFAGTVRSFCVLNAKASDTFVTKYYKWAKQRYGVV